ncbi:unnamed protein product [Darwinula stevensoni]|uniref:Uncharacterized protein n=1 Tax=Darwinula stevensoni TaxID=69355 RepID=A0A7R9FTC4_9CRUS|nr:unnamed protein product [Darwinula stevensoni]CAG0905168.1 unnamed protein product [Darwinula stevensoni]
MNRAFMKASGGYDEPHVPQPWEEKCQSEGGRALEKFRFNLERKDWTLGRDYGEEGITIKYLFDQETKTHFLLTEVISRVLSAYQVTKPKLGGFFARRDMVVLSRTDKIQDTYFISFTSTKWPGLEPSDGVVSFATASELDVLRAVSLAKMAIPMRNSLSRTEIAPSADHRAASSGVIRHHPAAKRPQCIRGGGDSRRGSPWCVWIAGIRGSVARLT